MFPNFMPSHTGRVPGLICWFAFVADEILHPSAKIYDWRQRDGQLDDGKDLLDDIDVDCQVALL